MEGFSVESRIENLSAYVLILGIVIQAILICLGAFVQYPDLAFCFFLLVAGLVELCKFGRVFEFTDDGVELYTCKINPNLLTSPSGGLDAMQGRLKTFDSEKDPMQRLMRSQIKTWFHRNVPREDLRSVELHYISESLCFLVIELEGCRPRNGQRILPFLLRNHRHVLCVISSLMVSMRYRELIEAYILK